MKKLTMLVIAFYIGSQIIYVNGQEKKQHESFHDLKSQFGILQNKQKGLETKVVYLLKNSKAKDSQISRLQYENIRQQSLIDSFQMKLDQLELTQKNDCIILNQQIEKTNVNVQANETSLSERSLWGSIIGVISLAMLVAFVYILFKKIKKGNSSIDEVRKAQEVLQAAQIKIQEESIKLDNKLLEVVEKQIITVSTMPPAENMVQDHSLALKVADEIVRIEMNLSHMESTIKGHKQLSKAVQRIKDNFNANGYEIVDMLGKQYVIGMKAAVTFITDENLKEGQRLITKIFKPQINFRQQMIQAAQIEVSQPE